MNTRFTSGEKIAVGGRRSGGGRERGRREGKERRGQEDHESRGRNGQQRAPAIHERVPKAQNKLLRASCLACSIFGAGTTIPGAESCGSVGKLGDPVGATTSNGDVREEGEGRERTQGGGGHRWTEGGEDTRREGEGKMKWEYEIVPAGEKTAVVFPSAVEEERMKGAALAEDR